MMNFDELRKQLEKKEDMLYIFEAITAELDKLEKWYYAEYDSESDSYKRYDISSDENIEYNHRAYVYYDIRDEIEKLFSKLIK